MARTKLVARAATAKKADVEPAKAAKAAPKTAAKATAKVAAAKAAEKKAPAKPAAKKQGGVTISVKFGSGKKVYIAGTFNNWNPTNTPMKEDQYGVYSATLDLPAGIYEYKFIVDEVWTLDPDPTRDWTQNSFGTLNSVLRV